MYEQLQIILWPDPRLKKVSQEVTAFDENLRSLTDRMFILMREHKGVGLAAPQVGVNLRVFVMNPTGELADDRVYVNPVLTEGEGEDEAEEGCLSLPNLNVNIWRAKKIRMDAKDAGGRAFQEEATGYLARIWQHEFDHLNGTLLTDRMGPVAKLSNRKLLRELQEKYEKDHGKRKKA